MSPPFEEVKKWVEGLQLDKTDKDARTIRLQCLLVAKTGNIEKTMSLATKLPGYIEQSPGNINQKYTNIFSLQDDGLEKNIEII